MKIVSNLEIVNNCRFSLRLAFFCSNELITPISRDYFGDSNRFVSTSIGVQAGTS